MDNELIERLAREAGLTEDDPGKWSGGFRVFLANPDDLRRFAALVAEECALIVEDRDAEQASRPATAEAKAAAIRAKFPRPA